MEIVSGCVAALSVAPFISIVDKAIVENSSGKKRLLPSLWSSMKLVAQSPIQFVRQPSFLLIWGVYSGTYIAANSIRATCELNHTDPRKPVLVGSSGVNITLSVLKDKAFARLFGVGPPKPLPVPSYALFAFRDSMTIFASFTLPEVVELHTGCSKNTSQLITPCAMQFASAPLHLLGLDLYNRGSSLSNRVRVADRLAFIGKEYFATALARCARILPAFGFGGVINRELREGGHALLKSFYGRRRHAMSHKGPSLHNV